MVILTVLVPHGNGIFQKQIGQKWSIRITADSKATEALFEQKKKEISMKIWLNFELFVMNMNMQTFMSEN